MNLDTDNYIYKLRFTLDGDAPPEYIKKWLKFKNKCEEGENREIVELIKEFCVLDDNKNLEYLDRMEGGMGGNNNSLNKQIRFRNNFLESCNPSCIANDNVIVLDQIVNTETEQWSYEEINDILRAFIKVSEYHVECEGCVRGCIEMTPNDIYRF